MSITVVNFISNYLRPALPDSTAWSDANLTSWIDASLLDISRSFPRATYALWTPAAGDHSYLFSTSTSDAKDTNIIRVLNCMYPFDDATQEGTPLARKSRFDTDFEGGNYFDVDNDAKILYVGPQCVAVNHIYSDCHVYWATVTNTITNPQEHYELIRLFVIWHAYLHQAAVISASMVPEPGLLNATRLQANNAALAYQAAYQKLSEAKSSSMFTSPWSMDKWDRNT